MRKGPLMFGIGVVFWAFSVLVLFSGRGYPRRRNCRSCAVPHRRDWGVCAQQLRGQELRQDVMESPPPVGEASLESASWVELYIGPKALTSLVGLAPWSRGQRQEARASGYQGWPGTGAAQTMYVRVGGHPPRQRSTSVL